MKLQLFYYTCGTCGNTYKSPEIAGVYGEFLMRNPRGDIVYLNANKDTVFDEFSAILKNHPTIINLQEMKRADIFQNIFGSGCDPSEDGTLYQITQEPLCPICGEANFKSFGPTSESIDLDVKSVTHNRWEKLSQEEKEAVVDQALMDHFEKHTN